MSGADERLCRIPADIQRRDEFMDLTSMTAQLMLLMSYPAAGGSDDGGTVSLRDLWPALCDKIPYEELLAAAAELVTAGFWVPIRNLTFSVVGCAELNASVHESPGYVYAMVDSAKGRIKVGRSLRPSTRLREVARAWEVPDLTLARTWRTENMAAAEAAMHEALGEHRGQAEWFHCPLTEIVAAAHRVGLAS